MVITTPPNTIIENLAAISSSEYVRIHEGSLITSPANTNEVAATLRYACGNNIVVTPFGRGTKQNWGNTNKSSLILQTHRLGTVLEHTWEDMTCTVEAGCTWNLMQSALAKHSQFVALDPLWPDHATVGGIIATNDSGSLRLRYGSLRDLIIGMTVVVADGTIARTGGKVVKNVAGYDLHKLMTGAFGTLGIITEVTFRLHSIPKHTQSLTIASPEAEPLGQLLLRLLDSQFSTQAIQLRASRVGFHLDVQLAALPEVAHDQANSVAALARGLTLISCGSSSNVWNARQECFNQTDSLIMKATMLPSEISRFTAAIHKLGGTSVTQAVGIMAATMPVGTSTQLMQLRQQLEANSGSLTILRQSDGALLDPWGTLPDTFPLMREIKRRFDPNRILNRGRFFGEI
jgi:glycolate oxidase FAD binding subunit